GPQKLPDLAHDAGRPLPFLVEADDDDGIGTVDVRLQLLELDVPGRAVKLQGHPVGLVNGVHHGVVEAAIDILRGGPQVRADHRQLLYAGRYVDLLVDRAPDILGEFVDVPIAEPDAEARIAGAIQQV